MSIEIFSSFTKEELIKIFSSSRFEIKKYGKDQIIHLQNEICSAMDVILYGKVIVQKIDENGKTLTVNVFSDREILGANLIFSSRNYYPMTVVSAESVLMLHLYKECVLDLCQNSVNFNLGMMTEISNKTVRLAEKINDISLKSIRQQIIDFLKYEYHIQKNTVIKLDFSKKELAERLGIQRSSLSRELSKMRKDGLLIYNLKTITIKNLPIGKE